MTRREALAALAAMFALFAAGLTWLLGPFGLIACGVLGTAAVIFCFERVDKSRGEDVADALPQQIVDALERNFSL